MTRVRTQSGFTLLEAIMAIVITGVLAGVVAVFIAGPVQGYVASVRRAELTDAANISLRRMSRDIRSALPNSVRVNGTGQFIEFLPTSGGGRYRAFSGDSLDFGAKDTTFQILGPPPVEETKWKGAEIVVFNLGIAGADAYSGNTGSSDVRRAVSGHDPKTNTVTIFSPNGLPFESPSNRFYILAQEQAVSYGCEGVGMVAGNGTGTLKRYQRYGINPAQAAPPGGSWSLLADHISACNIVYAPGSVTQRDATVSMVLQLTRADETVSLYQEVHVNNVP